MPATVTALRKPCDSANGKLAAPAAATAETEAIAATAATAAIRKRVVERALPRVLLAMPSPFVVLTSPARGKEPAVHRAILPGGAY
jgi:hypothetical protein